MKISDKLYDTLKLVAQYVLPFIGALYFGLAEIWGLPYVAEVVGSISALDAFLGSCLGISSMQYNKTKDGTLKIDTTDPDKDKYELQIDVPLEKLSEKKTLTLNVDGSAKLSQE